MKLESVIVSISITDVDEKYVRDTMIDNIGILSDERLPMGYDYTNARKDGMIFRSISVKDKGYHITEYKVLDYRPNGDILGKRTFDKHEVKEDLFERPYTKPQPGQPISSIIGA